MWRSIPWHSAWTSLKTVGSQRFFLGDFPHQPAMPRSLTSCLMQFLLCIWTYSTYFHLKQLTIIDQRRHSCGSISAHQNPNCCRSNCSICWLPMEADTVSWRSHLSEHPPVLRIRSAKGNLAYQKSPKPYKICTIHLCKQRSSATPWQCNCLHQSRSLRVTLGYGSHGPSSSMIYLWDLSFFAGDVPSYFPLPPGQRVFIQLNPVNHPHRIG